jgi:hypothetical protein
VHSITLSVQEVKTKHKNTKGNRNRKEGQGKFAELKKVSMSSELFHSKNVLFGK